MTTKEAINRNIEIMSDLLDRLETEFDNIIVSESSDYADLIQMANAMCHVSTKITEAVKESLFVDTQDRRGGANAKEFRVQA